MVDTLQITGKNTISFASGQRWQLYGQARPRGMSNPLTRNEAERELRNLPWEIRGHVLSQPGEHVLSKISFPFDIHGSSGADMEDALHDLIETLEDGALYIKTRGARGTKAQLVYKKDGASATSYKTIFYGLYDEGGARDVLGKEQMADKLIGAGLTLWSEPYWHPSGMTNLVNAQTIYNHDDTDSGHDNFVDIAAVNILGDVSAKVKMKIHAGNMIGARWFLVSRRSVGTVTNFIHWLEAENASSRTNWANHADTDRSNNSVVSDNANTAGEIHHMVSSNLADYKGKFGIYAALWANDIVNSQFRCYIQLGGFARDYFVGDWKWLGKASDWQILRLGELIIDDSNFATGGGFERFQVSVEYQKDASDTVECDYVFLLPLDESALWLDSHWPIAFTEDPEQVQLDATRDFLYVGAEDSTGPNYMIPCDLRGTPLSLQPRVLNRIYVKILKGGSTDPFTEHYDYIDNSQGANAAYVNLTIDYLPQYISPLE